MADAMRDDRQEEFFEYETEEDIFREVMNIFHDDGIGVTGAILRIVADAFNNEDFGGGVHKEDSVRILARGIRSFVHELTGEIERDADAVTSSDDSELVQALGEHLDDVSYFFMRELAPYARREAGKE